MHKLLMPELIKLSPAMWLIMADLGQHFACGALAIKGKYALTFQLILTH